VFASACVWSVAKLNVDPPLFMLVHSAINCFFNLIFNVSLLTQNSRYMHSLIIEDTHYHRQSLKTILRLIYFIIIPCHGEYRCKYNLAIIQSTISNSATMHHLLWRSLVAAATVTLHIHPSANFTFNNRIGFVLVSNTVHLVRCQSGRPTGRRDLT